MNNGKFTSRAQNRDWKALNVHIACALLVSLIFYIDLVFPLGVAVGSIYVVVILLAFWSPHARFILLVASVSSILVIAGFVHDYQPSIKEIWKVLFNRGSAIFIIWVIAYLGLKIKGAEQELVKIANHDFLTGLLNRREIFNRLNTEASRVDRVERPFSVIMLDIDHFKRINDNYGHHAGDKVLKETARVLREHLREYDYICRYGGEEFLVVTPETPVQIAQDLAERLRRIVMETRLHLPPFPAISVTVSAGVAQQVKGETIGTLISRADAALYRAKDSGRNQVVVSTEC